MDAAPLIRALSRFPDLLAAALAGYEDDELRWRPAPEAWSLIEVARHLLDEEREDFRPRLASTLEDPAREWPGIDPESWVVPRGYAQADPEETLRAFREERSASVAWLGGLGPVDWELAYRHPRLGDLHAGDLLVSWVAHDDLHLRQAAQRRYELAVHAAGGFSTDYAGPWRTT